MDNDQEKCDKGPDRRPRRYSVSSLRQKKVQVEAGSTLSTETHRGQLMVRIEPPEDDRQQVC